MNEMVSITREEYDRLCEAAEDLSDLQTYDRAMAAIASGEEELIPAEYAHRLIDGESAVLVYRELRGLSGADLARKAGLHRVQVHDIESGKSKGSAATLKKLADALGLTVDDLL